MARYIVTQYLVGCDHLGDLSLESDVESVDREDDDQHGASLMDIVSILI